MATKGAPAGVKRKSVTGTKAKYNGKPDGKAKKARLENPKPSKVGEEDSDDAAESSDSEDGGVKLGERSSHKGGKGSGKPSDGKTFEKGQTSRETHAKQKQLAQERKAAKPLADEVHRTKKIWERLRIKSQVPKDERQQLIDELYGIITGRVKDFVLKHDAVRAVQTAIKYSTAEKRKQIAKELQGTYAQLAESRYAKFLIGKLLVHDDEEIRNIIIPEFYGKVRKLINHPEASWILDDIYRTVATKDQKATLLREWYGPEFSLRELTKDLKTTSDLKEILQNEPSKRGPIMKSLVDMINTLVQKQMTGFTMLHDAMLQYFRNIEHGTEEFNEFVEMVKGDENGDLLKNLAFTRSGATLVCLLLAYGTSKDRKNLLKSYKDTFLLMSADQFAHVVILTAYDVIDDTKLTSKSIFPELLGEKEEEVAQNVVVAANNLNARTTFLYLFEGLAKSVFPPSHSFDLDILGQAREIRKTTSKKDDGTRRSELVAALSPHLITAIAGASTELSSTNFGCQFISSVLLNAAGDKSKALEAVAQAAGGEPVEKKDEAGTETQHVSHNPAGGRMLRALVQGGRFDKEQAKIVVTDEQLRGFSNTLYPVIKDYIVQWATGPSSFVVVGLVESSDFKSVKEVLATLKKNKKALETAANEATSTQAAAQGDGVQKGGKKDKKKTERSVGNAGSKILLSKL
ncbi:hypothetical protein S40293_00386 [Stachybotrys chartarum IBT 40293]|nr:hypothetical protein S40293_00386 [Stachybotrys chartarum IBT 40293]